ncbi:MAG TPA: CoA-binding protein [Chthoniobacterales bacterium]
MPSVAIIGASSDRRKFGNKAVRAYLQKGWTVYPVNPREQPIEGLQTFPTIADVPEPIDYVSLYVPPNVGLEVFPAIAARKPKEVWLNPGAESDELIEAASKLGLETVLACSIVAIGLSPSAL